MWDSATVIVSSQVVYAEARAALAAAHRSKRLSGGELRAAVAQLEWLVSGIRLVGVGDDTIDLAGPLAEKYALPGFDAIHLATILSVEARRVVVTTWDGRLAVASAECGMPVVPTAPAPVAA